MAKRISPAAKKSALQGPNQANDLLRSREPSVGALGIDFPAVDVNIQGAGLTQAQARLGVKLAIEILFQAHGLDFDLSSEETTLDVDSHEFAWLGLFHDSRKPDQPCSLFNCASLGLGEK